MSYETTMARIDAREAERGWRDHKQGCPRCRAAARSRNWPGLCSLGKLNRQAVNETAAILEANRKLDRAPIDGQAALF